MTLTRSTLEGLCDELIQRSMKSCKQCLKDAGVEVKELQEVVMVGGMSRMPKVFETVKQFFGREPFRGVNPDEAVAIGAAVQGSMLHGDLTNPLLLQLEWQQQQEALRVEAKNTPNAQTHHAHPPAR
jgi:molecular chaperone DnaK